MIKESDFINFCNVGIEILPMIKNVLNSDEREIFFGNLAEIRKVSRIISNEYEQYQLYPRYNLSKFYENLEYFNDYILKTDLDIKWLIDVNNIKLTEDNWSVYSKIEPLFKLYYKSIEISKLLEV